MMFDQETLACIWFVLLGLLLVGYMVLDGFDLGVGMLHPIARNDKDRRIMMQSIGPFWNGNEVWLVTFGGVLFGTFPSAYGTLLSGFYELCMLLLFGLIFRAVSLEFRSQVSGHAWRAFWDTCFWISSFLVTMILGIVIGNMILGVPLAQNLAIDQTILQQLNMYALLVGICFTSLFALHGSIFLYMKTGGDLQQQIHKWTKRTFFIFLFVLILAVVMTCTQSSRVADQFSSHGWIWVIAFVNVLSLAGIVVSLLRHHPFLAFVCSSATIATILALFAAIVYPTLIYSTVDPSWSLTLYNASAGEKSLGIMLIFAIIGFPFMMTYSFIIYRIFWRSQPGST